MPPISRGARSATACARPHDDRLEAFPGAAHLMTRPRGALAGRGPSRPRRRPPARDPHPAAQAVSPEANLRFDGAAGARRPRPALPARGPRGGPVVSASTRPPWRTGEPARPSVPGSSSRRSTRARCPPSRPHPWRTTTRSWPPLSRGMRRERDRPHRRGPPRAAARRPPPAHDQAHPAPRPDAPTRRAGPPRASSRRSPSTRSPRPRTAAHRAPPGRGPPAARQDARQDARHLRVRRRAVRRANSPPDCLLTLLTVQGPLLSKAQVTALVAGDGRPERGLHPRLRAARRGQDAPGRRHRPRPGRERMARALRPHHRPLSASGSRAAISPRNPPSPSPTSIACRSSTTSPTSPRTRPRPPCSSSPSARGSRAAIHRDRRQPALRRVGPHLPPPRDPATPLAATGRLVHHATILELDVESHRRRSALEPQRPRAAAWAGTAAARDRQGRRARRRAHNHAEVPKSLDHRNRTQPTIPVRDPGGLRRAMARGRRGGALDLAASVMRV